MWLTRYRRQFELPCRPGNSRTVNRVSNDMNGRQPRKPFAGLDPRNRKPSQGKGVPAGQKTNDGAPQPGPRRRNPFLWPLIVLTFVVLITSPLRVAETKPGTEVALSRISSLVADGKVKEAVLDDAKLTVTVTTAEGTSYVSAYPVAYSRDLATKFIDAGIKTSVVKPKSASLFSSLLLNLLPVVIILGFIYFLMRRAGSGIGGLKMSSKKSNPVEVPTTRFADVAGAEEALLDLSEVVDLLNNPEKYTTTGALPPRGFLLVGPPGTGKTLLARAVAGEAGVPFFSISGSDFVEMFVGLGASRVRELFGNARELGKAIIFIDEIDAIGKKRSGSSGFINGNDERENTLNQLLVEMDGFTQSGIVMIAATNRPDTLDPALTRPGRFDRKIMVPPPDRRGRSALFELYAKAKPFADDIDWDGFARRTPGMTGADIAALMNEAALEAARKGASVIIRDHIESALATTVLGRERRSAQVTDRDREIVAWHEAGHTVAALMLEDADDPVTVTIIPRGGAGGVTWMSGNDDDFLTRSQALAQLAVAMAGRAAEEVLLDGDHTQGAHGDLQSATSLATMMVTRYGMGKRMVALDRDRLLGGFDAIDDEVAALIEEALQTARGVVRSHRALLEQIVAELQEDETLHTERLAALRVEHTKPGRRPRLRKQKAE